MFLPEVFQKLHPKFNTPHILTWAVCIVSIFGTLTLNLDAAAAYVTLEHSLRLL